MRAKSDLLSGTSKIRPASGRARVQRRMNSADRRLEILSKASDFFSEYGLTAQTRALARACGIAQRLLYRYFPSKAALLEEVYKDAILAPFKSVWLVALKDRSQPVEQRLQAFYNDYFAAVLTRKWLRLFLYASLGEANMASDYIQTIIQDLMVTIVAETAHEQGVALPDDPRLVHEIGWILHGAVSHLAIRRHIYGASQEVAPAVALDMHIKTFLRGFAAAVEATRRAKGNGRKSSFDELRSAC